MTAPSWCLQTFMLHPHRKISFFRTPSNFLRKLLVPALCEIGKRSKASFRGGIHFLWRSELRFIFHDSEPAVTVGDRLQFQRNPIAIKAGSQRNLREFVEVLWLYQWLIVQWKCQHGGMEGIRTLSKKEQNRLIRLDEVEKEKMVIREVVEGISYLRI